MFGCREFMVPDGDTALAVNRILPLVSLGLGHFSAVDKSMAFLHAISLEQGLSKRLIQDYCDQVRIQLPDSGAEHIITDVVDVIDCFLDGDLSPARLAKLSGTYLFPKSLWVPETNHVWDLILRTSLKGILWFEDWFDNMNHLVNWLRNHSYFQQLQFNVPGERPELRACLKKPPTSIFKLRWGTLSAAVAEVVAMKDAVQTCLVLKTFPSGADIVKTHTIVKDNSFWVKTVGLGHITLDVELERMGSRVFVPPRRVHRGCQET